MERNENESLGQDLGFWCISELNHAYDVHECMLKQLFDRTTIGKD